MSAAFFSRNGVEYKRRWVLTGVVGETSSHYWHSVNEVLDPRPILEIYEILKRCYSDPKKALQLLKNGSIVHLAEKVSDCVFSGDSVALSNQPNPYHIEKYSVHSVDDEILHKEKIQFIKFDKDLLEPWRSSFLELNFATTPIAKEIESRLAALPRPNSTCDYVQSNLF